MKRLLKLIGCLLLLVVVGSVCWFFLSDLAVFSSPNRIGVVQVRGLIENAQDSLKAIKEFRENPKVKALLIRIDSPGGAVGPSQELYRELRRTIEKKPVVASLGSIGASGGYYIASGANRIVANPGTLTGSIGVIIYFPYLRELFEKIGYSSVTIKSGRFKDLGNPGREMTPEEKELIQGTIDEVHRQFIRDVAQARSLAEEKIREIADGRIIVGETAQQLGLIDELGNFEDAVNLAARLGGIEGEPELEYAKKKQKSLMDYLLGTEVTEQINSLANGSMSFLRYQMPYMP
jgi:protease IV